MKKLGTILNFAIAALLLFAGSFLESHLLGHVQGFTFGASPLVTSFTKQIKENLYPDNSFYKNSIDHSPYVNGDKVNVPQSGTNPTVTVNPSSFPLTVSQSTETALEYSINSHVTLPTHITDDEELIVSYDKRAHVLRKHINTINTSIADYFAYDWSPTVAGAFVRTSGADGTSLAPSATGTRKKITLQDWIDAATVLDAQDIPMDGRFALVPSKMYNEMYAIDSFIDYQKRGVVDMLAKGIIGEILGIKIYKRSRAGLYTNAGTPVKVPVGTAGAATHNMAILIWHQDSVARAEGGTKVYINPDKAEYVGGLFNARVRAGGQIDREDGKGVVAIIQAA